MLITIFKYNDASLLCNAGTPVDKNHLFLPRPLCISTILALVADGEGGGRGGGGGGDDIMETL